MKIRILGPTPTSVGLEKIGNYLKSKFSSITSDGMVMILVALSDKDVFSIFTENLLRLKNKIKIIIGIELGISNESLKLLHEYFGSNVFIYYNPRGFLFHPKLYIIKLSKRKAIIVVGSSNLTSAGFFKNFEINFAFELDLNIHEDEEMFNKAVELFNKILTLKSVKPLTRQLLNKLTKTKLPKMSIPLDKRRMRKLSDIFQPDEIEFEGLTNFIMTLSYNDVSGKRSDKYIRIPKRAVERNKAFWGWNNEFKPSRIAGFPERFIKIRYKGKTYKYRMYYAPEPHEFRLVFPQIYTLGESFVGSILWIKKTDEKYEVKLIKKKHKDYKKFLSYCTETSPKGKSKVPKKWGYF